MMGIKRWVKASVGILKENSYFAQSHINGTFLGPDIQKHPNFTKSFL